MADGDLEADGSAVVHPPPPPAAAASHRSVEDSSDDDRPLATLAAARSSQWAAMKRAGRPHLKVTPSVRKGGKAPAKKRGKKSASSSSNSSRVLSIFELCNTDDEARGGGGGGPHDALRDRTQSFDSDADASTLGSEADAGSRDDDTTSTVDGDNGSDLDEGWADHNRWYCNICKDGGELLCCDRCPRAFHMSCLGMGETAIPDTEWYCKMCAECLDRRRAKSEKKEKARLLREAEKLERDARKLQIQQLKEEELAKKSADAIESKAKRVLEMQDRILSRKKIKYKDKEEEKLGKLAEDLAQTVRDAKEKLDKLEKEDAALKKKEEALNKKKKSLDDLPDGVDDAVRSEKPIPLECAFGEVPAKHMGTLLAVWDSIASFSEVLKLSPISVEHFGLALMHREHTTVLAELHMCLLELVLEDREDEEYMSDDENAMDERERYRYEVQHAPLTVGLPTLAMLNSLSWPSVLHSLIVAVPRHTAYATMGFRAAVAALYSTEYPALRVRHKLSLLHFLVRRVFGTEKIRRVLGKHLGESIQASKEFNRAVLQDRKVALEDEKRLREKQRAELAGLVEKSKAAVSVKPWGKGDKKSGAEAAADDVVDDGALSDGDAPGSASESEADDLALNEEALAKNDEELERLALEDRISRHEYLARKKALDSQRERLRKVAEEKLRRQRAQDQMERKRAAAKKGIQEGLLSKDAGVLHAAIEKGKECALPDRIIVSATHVLEILDAEAARDEEASSRKRKFNDMLRRSFVRTEPLGRDRSQCRYWVLHGDQQRLYIEKPSAAQKLKEKYDAVDVGGRPKTPETPDGAQDDAVWYCYSSEAEVVALIESLDARIPREALLKAALADNFELITSEMPMCKPGLLISDLLNEDSIGGRKRQRKGASSPEAAPTDFLAWRNERRTWRKAPHEAVGVDAFREDLTAVEAWLSKRLRDLGSSWGERAPSGRADWLKRAHAAEQLSDLIALLLALEAEAMAFQLKARGLPLNGAALEEASKPGGVGAAGGDGALRGGDNDKSDDEDDEEDEEDVLVDDGSVLWPTTHCRSRWIGEVKKAQTISTLAVALAALEQRLEVFGLGESAGEDHGVSTRRAKSEKEKRSRKERAAAKKKIVEEDDALPVRDSNDEWDEDCYVCSEGGELLCCDGCPRVFHYTCAGLRRIPRGKTFCHICDPTVKPVFPVAKGVRSSARDAVQHQQQPATGSADVRGAAATTNGASSGDDHIHPASSGNPQTTTKSSEDQWDVDCSVCALGGELLCCDGCPRAFHVACIGLETIPDDEWFCDECNLQACAACKKNKIRLDSHVICGSEDGTKGCEGVFHLKCARLSAVPVDDWFCKKCRGK